jgi:hypothetical protein
MENGDADYTEEQTRAETDYQLIEAQEILENITKASEELRKRKAEISEMNNAQAEEIEERDHEIERLRSENEALKSDLGFDHSELLFLKLQMNAIEMEVDELADNDYRIVHVNPDGRRQTKRAKKDMIMLEMNRWREDWHDVESRFQRRMSQYGDQSVDGEDRTVKKEARPKKDGDDAEWRLETVREGRERIASITVRRLDGGAQCDGITDKKYDATKPTYVSQSCQTPATAPKYADSSVQTDISLSPWEDVFDEPEDDETVHQDEDDCAITTSDTTREPSPTIAAQEPTPAHKSAWAELWEGLGQLAGVNLDD